ncbi:unnamed protein product [Dracunculus medinensis]|uniref:Secreted protein n=1 Tax=Dracunculus medinensis TaxID=318479 RepID=A0A0N4UP51_DRAME|nr:unnamed protein product [Dracunculus medinensis]
MFALVCHNSLIVIVRIGAVLYTWELTDFFETKTGNVCQSCVLSPTVFNCAIDCIMGTSCRPSRSVQIRP